MLRALLFGFHGVLVDDEPIRFELLRRVLREEGAELSIADYRAADPGLDDRGCLAAALSRAGRPASSGLLVRLLARKATYHQEVIRRQGFAFFPGALDFVAAAAERGFMLGLVSGALLEEVEQALRQARLRDRFKVLVTVEDVKAGKPSPEGHLLAIEALNSRSPLPERMLHPHEILALEGTPGGIEAAAAAGFLTLGLGHTVPVSRLRTADWVAPALADVVLESLQAPTMGAGQFTGTRPEKPSS